MPAITEAQIALLQKETSTGKPLEHRIFRFKWKLDKLLGLNWTLLKITQFHQFLLLSSTVSV